MKSFVALCFLSVLHLSSVCAQEYEYTEEDIYRSPFRAFLNNFSVTFTTGYGVTNYSHSLQGLYYLQTPIRQYIAENNGAPLGDNVDVIGNWFNNPVVGQALVFADSFDVPFRRLQNPVNNPLLRTDVSVFNADSLGLEFSGKGRSIPLFLSLRYNYQKFRIGGGLMLEYHRVGRLKPNVLEGEIREYVPDFKTAFFTRYFLTLGYRFYDFWDYSFAGEVEVGRFNDGSKFNGSFIQRGMYANLGLSIEKNLSEYFRVIVKPSFDFKSYDLSVPGTNVVINHKQPSWFLQFGISITFPEIPRSPMKSDHVQLKHVYTDPESGLLMEVRGQPIWKKQNPKVGENDRKLWRYKNKNKRKLNPY